MAIPSTSLTRRLGRPLAALAAFAMLAIVLTWPLAVSIDTHLAGEGAGDNVSFLWSFWWMRTVLAGSDPLFQTTALFFPFGTGLVLHTHAFLGAFIGATVLSGLSIVTAYNLLVIAAVALNGWCTYLLALRVTRHTTASLIAGVYFAAAPYFAGHLAGHFNLVPAWMLPVFALAALRAMDTGSWTAAAGAGVVLAAAAWSDYYYTVYLLVFLAVLIGVRWIDLRWERLPSRPSGWIDAGILTLITALVVAVVTIRVTGGGVFTVGGVRISATTGLPPLTAAWALGLVWLWRRQRGYPIAAIRPGATMTRDIALVGVMAVASAIGAAPILREAVHLLRADAYVTPPGFLRSAAVGVDPVSLIFGNPFHSIWGRWLHPLYVWADISIVENTAWFGLVGLFLVVATRGFTRLPAEARLWRVTALLFAIWALGPYLVVLGENTGLYLPAALLRLVPVLDSLRIPGRAIVMTYLALSVLIAMTLSRLPRPSARLWTGVTALILIDFIAVPLPMLRIDPPAMYGRLRDMPSGAVLDLPMGIRDGYGSYGALDHETLLYQTIHGKPVAGGFVARLSEDLEQRHLESPLFGPLLRLSAGEPIDQDESRALQQNARRMLTDAGFRYIVIRADAPRALHDVVAATGARLLTRDDTRALYALDDP